MSLASTGFGALTSSGTSPPDPGPRPRPGPGPVVKGDWCAPLAKGQWRWSVAVVVLPGHRRCRVASLHGPSCSK